MDVKRLEDFMLKETKAIRTANISLPFLITTQDGSPLLRWFEYTFEEIDGVTYAVIHYVYTLGAFFELEENAIHGVRIKSPKEIVNEYKVGYVRREDYLKKLSKIEENWDAEVGRKQSIELLRNTEMPCMLPLYAWLIGQDLLYELEPSYVKAEDKEIDRGISTMEKLLNEKDKDTRGFWEQRFV